ncbi:MAG: RNA methyltransferase [Salinivirgaceae bacterium]|jgi:23S rRNA (guanosine2251-2'-O)-methyltransferase|nr:RNA methyltransferase [Bacteroidales bacterium]
MTRFRKLSMDELDRISVNTFRELEKRPMIIVLDNIRSAHNVGSFFRTADAFRIQKIYLCGITSYPPNKEIQKTALGATESVEWEYVSDTYDTVKKLKAQNFTIIAVEQAEQSIKLNEYNISTKNQTFVLIFGNEVNGIDDKTMELCDHCIEIPQWGTKHSLNVAVSGGVVLWEFAKQMNLP